MDASDYPQPSAPDLSAPAEPDALGITRRLALAGGSAGLAAALLAACGGSGSGAATTAATKRQAQNHTGAATVFGSSSVFRFTVVNHETSNPFFQPLRYGLADACTLLGCSFEWVGSRSSQVEPMVSAINSAISAGVDGIATTLIAPKAFDEPIANAIGVGIPVVAYNSDVAGSPRLAYIGQDLLRSGKAMGERISRLLPSGGKIALFVSTPGTSNVQPRINGVRFALEDRPDIEVTTVATGTSAAAQLAAVQSYTQLHPNLAGYFGIDAGSTNTLAQTLAAENLPANGTIAGGYDPSPSTEKLLAAGQLDFVIDQQPYLQGFMAILELYLYKVSEGLVGTADVDTGLKVLDKDTVLAYSQTMSRYEGTSSVAGVQRS